MGFCRLGRYNRGVCLLCVKWVVAKTRMRTDSLFMSRSNAAYVHMSASGQAEWHFRHGKTPTSFIWVKRGNVVKGGGEGGRCEMISASPCPYSELRTTVANGRGLRRRSQVGVQKWREKGSRRWGGCWWGWCEDENWFIAALMRSGMPGDGGCSPSPCCGNIKRNRGPPSRYNCCRDLSKGSRSLCRNVCNPDCCYPACYSQSPCLHAASRDIGHAFCSALLAAWTYSVNINPTHPQKPHRDQSYTVNINTHSYRIHISWFISPPLSNSTPNILIKINIPNVVNNLISNTEVWFFYFFFNSSSGLLVKLAHQSQPFGFKLLTKPWLILLQSWTNIPVVGIRL